MDHGADFLDGFFSTFFSRNKDKTSTMTEMRAGEDGESSLTPKFHRPFDNSGSKTSQELNVVQG